MPSCLENLTIMTFPAWQYNIDNNPTTRGLWLNSSPSTCTPQILKILKIEIRAAAFQKLMRRACCYIHKNCKKEPKHLIPEKAFSAGGVEWWPALESNKNDVVGGIYSVYTADITI